MHDIIIDELENHLSQLANGVADGRASRTFYAHLAECPACLAEVAGIEGVSAMLREMRSPFGTAPEPRLGFYNRVAGSIVDSQRNEAWGLFAPGPLFFRRIAFVSLLLLAGLGSFLVSRESAFINPMNAGGRDAAAIMAQHDPAVTHSESSDRDRMLVTLATYRPE